MAKKAPGAFVVRWLDEVTGLSTVAKGAWMQLQVTFEKASNPTELTRSVEALGHLFECPDTEVVFLLEALSIHNLIRYVKRECNGLVTLTHLHNEAKAVSSLSSSLRVSKHRERLGKDKTPIPEGFSLDEEMRTFATERNVDVTLIETEFDAFRAYHEKHGSVMANWKAAWRTWILGGVKNGWIKSGRTNLTTCTWPIKGRPCGAAGYPLCPKHAEEKQRIQRQQQTAMGTP